MMLTFSKSVSTFFPMKLWSREGLSIILKRFPEKCFYPLDIFGKSLPPPCPFILGANSPFDFGLLFYACECLMYTVFIEMTILPLYSPPPRNNFFDKEQLTAVSLTAFISVDISCLLRGFSTFCPNLATFSCWVQFFYGFDKNQRKWGETMGKNAGRKLERTTDSFFFNIWTQFSSSTSFFSSSTSFWTQKKSEEPSFSWKMMDLSCA